MRYLLTVLVVLAALLPATAALAGFQAGLNAYLQGDYATALREWRPLAMQGHPSAQFTLGTMYFKGQGVPPNLDQALKWWRKADEQGNDQARKTLATAHAHIQRMLTKLGFDPGPADGVVGRKSRNAIRAFRRSRNMDVTGDVSENLIQRLIQAVAAARVETASKPQTETKLKQHPPTDPILRLETGMHTAAISRIGVDAAGRLLVTASSDKTVRLWSLPGGRPLRVLRVPMGDGNEGRLDSVAVSSDGALVATGGWTGSWDNEGHIYLFDVASGRLVRRLTGLPDVIYHLAFSRDGRFLAATMFGQNGVRVWRTSDWRQVLRDADYGGGSLWADFDVNGRLVTTCLDGNIRLYNRDFHLVSKRRGKSGTNPITAVFSPRGRRIAVGYDDSTRVDVLSGRDLGFLFAPDTAGVNNNSLSSVSWSMDGRFLYAGGKGKIGTNPIRRWADGGRGAHLDLAAAQSTIIDIRARPEGGIAFGTAYPAFGAFDGDGRKVLERTAAIADFRGVYQGGFLVSRDGSKVQFGFDYGGKRPARLSIGKRKLTLSPLRDHALVPPKTSAPGLTITDWGRATEPTLNGWPLELYHNEISRSLAIGPGGESFLLGTEWYLRLFNRDGRQKWMVPVPDAAWGVNIAGNGRLAVAAFGDGTIRWYRMRDGVEILAFFPHRNGSDWVAWTPDGYYMSSPGGDNLIGWHINNGRDAAPDFYSARQFERILHRPDYVLAYFKHLGDRQKAMAEAGGDFFDITKLASIAPPKIEITAPTNGASISGDRVRLRFAVEKRSLPMRDYSVFVNGIPVTPTAERALGGTESGSFAREMEIPLFGADNDIRIEAFNGTSMGVAETFVRWGGNASAAVKGNLYLLAVGANRFPGLAGADLDYAAFDAEAMAAFFKGREGGAFGRVFTKTVSDNATLKPTRRIILEMLEFIKRATAQDTVIVFLASHGLSDSRGTYYFVPQDAAGGDVETVLASAQGGRALTEGDTDAPSLISWQSFFEALRSTAGRRLLVVDTCQAKNIAGTFDIHSLAKRSASASFALMAASQGTESSQEYPPGKHGLFTYAILQGLAGKGDGNGDGRITLDELFKFTVGFVNTNRPHAHLPQTPQLTAPGMLGEMVLARRQETTIGPFAPLPVPPHKVTADPAHFFRVQLVSTRSWDGLQAEWNRLQRNNRDLLGELKPSIDKADLGRRKGAFYRLRAGPVADEQTARSLCAALKKRRIGCFIVPPKG